MTKKTSFAMMAVAGAIMAAGTANAGEIASADGMNMAFSADKSSSRSSTLRHSDIANAQSRMPMLTDASQIPRSNSAGNSFGDRSSQAYGMYFEHPYTTKRVASQRNGKGIPTNMAPYKAAGKLWMRFGDGWYVCSASAVELGMLVTAAHCVFNYGAESAGWADEVVYQPARHADSRTFGTWDALTWAVPTVYYNGTDDCEVPGIVCANDLAVVLLDTGPEGWEGMEIAEVTRRYKVSNNDYGYGNFDPTASDTPIMKAAHLTALGYPQAHDSGLKMMRTDSFGYQATPNNVIMGSAQTGGSSGGPWINNFGKNSVFGGSTGSGAAGPRVAAVTSWGYSLDTIKVQGASRFGNNSIFTSATNIDSMMSFGCSLDATKCY